MRPQIRDPIRRHLDQLGSFGGDGVQNPQFDLGSIRDRELLADPGITESSGETGEKRPEGRIAVRRTNA